MTKQQALAKIIGQIHRIATTTTQLEHRMKAIKEFRKIAKHLNYKTKTIKKALIQVHRTTSDPHWLIIYDAI